VAGRRVQRTRYRPDRWLLPEVLTVLAGLAVATALTLTVETAPLVATPEVGPPTWPTLALLPVGGLLLALLPAVGTPPAPGTPATPSARAAGDRAVRVEVPA